MNLVVPTSEINKLIKFTSNNILYPKIEEISKGIRQSIARESEPIAAYKSSSGMPSIKSMSATTHITNKKVLRSTIKPLVPTFMINKKGYTHDRYVYADDNPGLRNWIQANYTDMNSARKILAGTQKLRIRGKYNLGGFQGKPPLGDPERDVFRTGFIDFIINKSMYGLS